MVKTVIVCCFVLLHLEFVHATTWKVFQYQVRKNSVLKRIYLLIIVNNNYSTEYNKIYNSITCNSTDCTISSYLTDNCMSVPYYPASSLVKGNCDDLTQSSYNNCFFAYSEAKFDQETVKWVVYFFLMASLLLCIISVAVLCIRRLRKDANNRDLQYSSIVATDNENRSNYSTVQQVSVSPSTESNREPERISNNQENCSPYQHVQPSYFSLNNNQ